MFFESFKAIKAAAKLYKFTKEAYQARLPTVEHAWPEGDRELLVKFMKRVASKDTRKPPINLEKMVKKWEEEEVGSWDAIEAATVLLYYLTQESGTYRDQESEHLRNAVSFWIYVEVKAAMMQNSAYKFKASANISYDLRLRCAIMEIEVYLKKRGKHYETIEKSFAAKLKKNLRHLDGNIKKGEALAGEVGSVDEKNFKNNLEELVEIGFRLPVVANQLENSAAGACGLLLTYLENQSTRIGNQLKTSLKEYKSILEEKKYKFVSNKLDDVDVAEYGRGSEDDSDPANDSDPDYDSDPANDSDPDYDSDHDYEKRRVGSNDSASDIDSDSSSEVSQSRKSRFTSAR